MSACVSVRMRYEVLRKHADGVICDKFVLNLTLKWYKNNFEKCRKNRYSNIHLGRKREKETKSRKATLLASILVEVIKHKNKFIEIVMLVCVPKSKSNNC